jgi:hypothetical protein
MSPVDGSPEDLMDVGVSRRRILAVGGFSVAMAAVVAACAADKPHAQVPQAGAAPTTTGLPEQVITDEVLLRTASSLEHTLVGAYAAVLALGTLPADAAETVRLFSSHHTDHAAFFEKSTRDIGGSAFTDPNAALQAKIVDPALKAIADAGNKPGDLLWFVYGLENVAAGTFQAFVPALHVPSLRGDVMSVGGIEARHAAIATKLIPTATVVPPAPEDAAAAPTTTTIKGGTTTTTPAAQAIPVSQVPGSFGSLTAVAVAIVDVQESWDILGPNSYQYVSE